MMEDITSRVPPGVPPELRGLHEPGGAISAAAAAQQAMLDGYTEIDRTLLPGLQACGLKIDSVDGLEGSILTQYPVEVRRSAVDYAVGQIPLIWGRGELDVHARRNRVDLLVRQLAAADLTVSAAPLIELFEKKLPETLAYTVASVMERATLKAEPATMEWLKSILRGQREELFSGIDTREASHIVMTKAAFAMALARVSPTSQSAEIICQIFENQPVEFGKALKRIALDAGLDITERRRVFEFLDSRRDYVHTDWPKSETEFSSLVESTRKKLYPGPRAR